MAASFKTKTLEQVKSKTKPKKHINQTENFFSIGEVKTFSKIKTLKQEKSFRKMADAGAVMKGQSQLI